MSDSDSPNNQDNEMKYSPQDALTDSLLRQVAANRRGDDEVFLDRVEAAIDAEEGETITIPMRKAKSGPRLSRTIVRASAIAAVIAVGIIFWLVNFHLDSTRPEPMQIVANTGPTDEMSLDEWRHTTAGESHPGLVESVPVVDSISLSEMALSEQPADPVKIGKVQIDGNAKTRDGIVRRGMPSEFDASPLMADAASDDFTVVGHGGVSTGGVVAQGAGRKNRVDVSGSDGKITVSSEGIVDATGSGHQVSGSTDGNSLSLSTGLSSIPPSPGADAALESKDVRFAEVGHVGNESYRDYGRHLSSGDSRVDGEGVVPHVGYSVSPGVSTARADSDVLHGGVSLSVDFGEPESFGIAIEGEGEMNRRSLRLNPSGGRSTRYSELIDNEWMSPRDEPLSTFSTDVDTASWTNLRGMIRSGLTIGQIPRDAVRIEEMINYFDWDYPQPEREHPFTFATETASCPWNADHQLLRVGVQGAELAKSERPDANLVFLLDVSGSMNQPNKLALVKKSIMILAEELREGDCVSMVVYAGAEGLALPATSGRDTMAIANALSRLNAGGSTNGGAGIKLAYRMAQVNFVEDGINRVILCTDGDFNVGITGNESLVKLVESRAKGGVFLSVLGYGNDNLNDSMLEEITNKGNGNYFFVDSLREARKVFLRDLMGTLVAIAKDVKIQIEFNPGKVDSYRLIGYANRKLEAEDFENDRVDAGEVGSGHSVTALYEIVPAGKGRKDGKGLRYQKSPEQPLELVDSDELALLKLRYKRPDSDVSTPITQPVLPVDQEWREASGDFRFASAVSLFGLILRDHESVRDATLDEVVRLAESGKGSDPHGYRAEFIDLVRVLRAAEGR